VPNDPVTGKQPNLWKTACLVLLPLFPVVMLEIRFLKPHLRTLNPAVGTFIVDAITVVLTTWPLMPLAICALPREQAALAGDDDAGRAATLLSH
jgi:antibiotic biosynthesis monooxygenase (ABM) superfamily enzyme